METLKYNSAGGTDLDRLHAVVSMETPGRGAGRTFADCHTVAGIMEVTDEAGVLCLVPSFDRVSDIMGKMVFRVFVDHGISFYKALNNIRFIFNLPDKLGRQKQVLFVIKDFWESRVQTRTWPMIDFTEFDIDRGADSWKKRVPLL